MIALEAPMGIDRQPIPDGTRGTFQVDPSLGEVGQVKVAWGVRIGLLTSLCAGVLCGHHLDGDLLPSSVEHKPPEHGLSRLDTAADRRSSAPNGA